MKNQKGKSFPVEALFDVYEKHPVRFYKTIDNSNLSFIEDNLLFYLLYDCDEQIRINDRDHIHPSSLLNNQGVGWGIINDIGNFQLLDVGTNRGEKSNMPLDKWIEEKIENKELYLRRHLIPKDPNLWRIENYNQFLQERRNLIVGKINSALQV